MSESHEPSYYEIALTNRQVLVAFVVLLVCLLGAFLSGVWVGRTGEAGQATASAPARPATVAGQAAEPLEELRFFSEDQTAPPSGVTAAPPRPAVPEPGADTTLLADLGGAPATPPTAAAPEDAEAEAPAPSADAPEPAVAPTPPAAAPATPPAAAATPPAPTPAPGELVIQVFSSPDGVQANRILDRLVRAGYRAFLSPVQVGSQTMHRVRIGPFAQRGEAQKIADQVRQRFQLETWITR